MNKKWLLIGTVAVAAFVTTTAFKGKTLEEQKAEIQTAVTAKLDEFRMQKDGECTARVTAEAQTRFTQWMAEQEAAAAATPGKKGSGKKSTTKPTGPVTPLPPSTTPTNPTKKQEGMDAGGKTEQKKQQMDGPGSKTESKKKKMDAPGGGGN